VSGGMDRITRIKHLPFEAVAGRISNTRSPAQSSAGRLARSEGASAEARAHGPLPVTEREAPRAMAGQIFADGDLAALALDSRGRRATFERVFLLLNPEARS
jgi:hypothetical protein